MTTSPATVRSEKAVLFIIFFSGLISALNTGLLYVAYLTLADVFQTDLNTVQWLTAIFTLTSAMVTPTAGYFAKRHSLRKMLMFSFVLLCLASLCCALSPNIYCLIASRAVQGMAAGLMTPLSLAIIYQWIPREKQGMYLSISLAGMSLGPAIGPSLSGFLLAVLDWHAIFICNIPVALVNLVLVYDVLPREEGAHAEPVDVKNIALVFIGTLLILLSIYEAGSIGWQNMWIWLGCAIGVIILCCFTRAQLRSPRPLADFHLFRIRPFAISIVVSAILYVNVTLIAFLMPVFLESGRGMTPLSAGTLLFFPAIGMALATPVAGRVYKNCSARTLLIAGLSVMLAGTLLVTTFDTETPLAAIIAILAVRYIGAAFANVPSLDYGLGALPKEKASDGTALNNWIKSICISLSLTIFTALYSLGENHYLTHHEGAASAEAAVYVNSVLFWLQGATILFALLLILFATPRRHKQ